MQQQIDVNPTDYGVELLHRLLLAEADQLVTGAGSTLNVDKPKVKYMASSSTGGGGGGNDSKPCRFWGTPEGCRKGRECIYAHSWLDLADKQSRCWCCSSTSHSKKDCPTSKQSGSGTGGSDGSRDLGKSGGKGKKGKSKGSGGSKESPKEGPKDKGQETATKSPEKGGDKNGEKVAVDKGKEAENPGDQKIATEISGLIKMLSTGGAKPKISAVKMASVSDKGTVMEKMRVLIDGGATHCLRQMVTTDKNYVKEVKVHLAKGDIQLLQHRETGTLLSETAVQPIIPVALLVQGGSYIQWDNDECVVVHPRYGKLEIIMEQGCPTVDWQLGMDIIREIEDQQKADRRGALRMRWTMWTWRTLVTCRTWPRSFQRCQEGSLKGSLACKQLMSLRCHSIGMQDAESERPKGWYSTCLWERK